MISLTERGAPAAALLSERGETVAVSESAAGGLISAALLSLPGASGWFAGGGVIYTRAARRGLLGFTAVQSRRRGATEEYALLCAREIRARLGAVWGLAESGAAGPGANRYGDAAGHVCVAVAGPVDRSRTIETGSSGREDNMWAFADAALALFGEALDAAAAVTVYGISNCDRCRAARRWLADQGIGHRYRDYDTDGLDRSVVEAWIAEHGWDALLNRRSATWRALPEAVRAVDGPADAAALLEAHPRLLRRPVICLRGRSLVGFSDEIRATLTALCG